MRKEQREKDARKAQRGKYGEVRTAGKGWRGDEGNDGEARKERMAGKSLLRKEGNNGEDRMAKEGRISL